MLTKEVIFEILENIYNEVYVTDQNMKIIYVNHASSRHSGLSPESIIGKDHLDIAKGRWYPCVLALAQQEKKIKTIEQVTYLGQRLISTVVPVFDDDNNLEMLVTISEESLDSIDLKYANSEILIDNNYRKNPNELYENFITSSTNLEILHIINKLGYTDVPILITGETGTGKSVIAQIIHNNSHRSEGPFVIMNCASIHDSLMESEIFGYEPYAFTGASSKGKVGLFEIANGGTLFLDEIGEMPLALQTKLLSVIEDKCFIPVGGKEIREVDVRIISATNRNIESMIKKKTFREDLYWRINTIPIEMTALRKRKEELLPLINEFLKQYNKKYSYQKYLSKEAFETLMRYNWPGNVRQLKNVIERGCILSESNEIKKSDLPTEIVEFPETNIENDLNDSFHSQVKRFEQGVVRKLYSECNSIDKVAAELKISKSKVTELLTQQND